MDTEVSILNRKLVKEEKEKVLIKDWNLKYFFDKKVLIKFKVVVEIQLRIYFIEIPMLVSKINNLLSVNFFRTENLENVFEFAFGILELKSPKLFMNWRFFRISIFYPKRAFQTITKN